MEHFGKDLLWIIESDNSVSIDAYMGIKLQNAVSDALINFGLNKDDLPNEYGILLEDLIDELK